MMNRKGSYMTSLPLPIKSDDVPIPCNNQLRKSSNEGSDKRRSSFINQSQQMYVPRKSIFVRRSSNAFLSRKSSEPSQVNQILQRFQPTYKMEPEEHEKFKPWLIEPKIEEVLEDCLNGLVYTPTRSSILSKEISQNILREIRNMPITLSPRYKLIANVLICESKG